MKYSLRSLMIVVTLVCVLIGARIEYLRSKASAHEREAAKLETKIGADQLRFALQVHDIRRKGEPDDGCFIDDDHRQYVHHRNVAAEYRQAMFLPWTVVNE